jgi:predicted lactoylglutathione lyase
MPVPKHPGRDLFVSLPVRDLEASIAFFTRLGFTFSPLFSDENGTCMLIGEQAYMMLVTHDKFRELGGEPIDGPVPTTAAYCFSVPSREAVDEVVTEALAAGGTSVGEPDDYGFMYQRAFRDLDGYHFEALWMDPAAAEAGPPADEDALAAQGADR